MVIPSGVNGEAQLTDLRPTLYNPVTELRATAVHNNTYKTTQNLGIRMHSKVKQTFGAHRGALSSVNAFKV